jgi:1-aminocyclopropane-1-carboxylate deaminase/D-cysteine desulfhydrase-like pyridoxal-dependent ACC family enzyme
MMTLNQSTPIESYVVADKIVYVKREDLYGTHPLPPLSKLRGLKKLLDRLYAEGVRTVGCWDTRVSKLGQGVAVIAQNYPGMRAIVSYPKKIGEPVPRAIEVAATHGAEIYPVRGNHVIICYSQVGAYVRSKGGTMLPFGLECTESVAAISEEASTVPSNYYSGGTVLLSCGSGVTLAGILSGLRNTPSKIIGISSGRSVAKITKCITNYAGPLPDTVAIKENQLPYYATPVFDCPFPTHPNYDLKAWQYLVKHIDQLEGPILFWNIGA